VGKESKPETNRYRNPFAAVQVYSELGVVVPSIVNFATIWRYAVSFTFSPLYIRGRNSHSLLNRILVVSRANADAVGKRSVEHAMNLTTVSCLSNP
jgi:hypothetical protein